MLLFLSIQSLIPTLGAIIATDNLGLTLLLSLSKDRLCSLKSSLSRKLSVVLTTLYA